MICFENTNLSILSKSGKVVSDSAKSEKLFLYFAKIFLKLIMLSTNQKKILQREKRNLKKHLREVERKTKFHNNSKYQERIHRFQLSHQSNTFLAKKEIYFNKFGHFIVPGNGFLTIDVPSEFCLCTNYSRSMACIKEFASSIYDYIGFKIIIDFSKCTSADSAALFLMQIIRLEMLAVIEDLKELFPLLHFEMEIDIVPSSDADVVRLLFATGYPIDMAKFTLENKDNISLIPIDPMGFFRGKSRQQHIRENRKPIVTQKVVDYMNKCLDIYGYQLREDDKNSVGGIIGEVLSNAEDHSESDTWFITANFSIDPRGSAENLMGELNLAIMNFGLSFYESFVKTAERNHEIYDKVEDLVNNNRDTYPQMKFEDEQLYTLIMMSEQISRLKYKEESRGTGTIKFLKSFIDMGDYVDKANGYVPNLSLFTGSTQLICDNELKPFLKETVYCLSLNPEEDLRKPPMESHLKVLTEKFPGTLLSVKIYLNKQHLDKKYGGKDHEN